MFTYKENIRVTYILLASTLQQPFVTLEPCSIPAILIAVRLVPRNINSIALAEGRMHYANL